jgi:glutathione S-transferase
MLKFFMTPGSCSTGIHILLEECEAVFEVAIINLLAGDQNKPEYLAINPKATIPTLQRDEHTALTTFQSIAWWLAHQFPRAGLLPDNLQQQLKIIEAMNYAIATLHMQGFARLFTTDKFTPHASDYEWVKTQGQDIINQGFTVVDGMISDQGYITERFSIADAALFYVEFWADKTNIELPENCRRHYQQMLQRPAVQQVLAEEGYRI